MRKYSVSPPNVDRLYQLPLLSNSIAKQKDAKISMFEEEEEKKKIWQHILYERFFEEIRLCAVEQRAIQLDRCMLSVTTSTLSPKQHSALIMPTLSLSEQL